MEPPCKLMKLRSLFYEKVFFYPIDLFRLNVLFPNTGHVIILQGTVSLKFRDILLHMYA